MPGDSQLFIPSEDKGPLSAEGKKKKALSGDFDFPRKRKPTVPLYADGLRLLAFGAFLTTYSVSKNTFLTRWKTGFRSGSLFLTL